MDKELGYIFDQNINQIRDIDRLVYNFRIQNFDMALRISEDIINRLSRYLNTLLSRINYFNECPNIYDENTVLNMLQDLLNAQEEKDYILLADLYELIVNPFFLTLQSEVIRKEKLLFNSNYNENLNQVEIKYPLLYECLNQLQNPEILLKAHYSVEYTSCGVLTLAAHLEGRKFYIHSNGRVQYEAFILANSWYKEKTQEYVIYGLGFGYHIKELVTINKFISVKVYESNLSVIQLACAYSSVFGELINNQLVEIIYDPELSKLKQKLLNKSDNTELFIHHPSMKLIKNITIKEKMENYFIQYNSINNQVHLLNGNFDKNIQNYYKAVDELEATFKGKDLFIVAAGPSLDFNYKRLKDVGKNGIILATGTVFKKLLKEGISPHYVIVTDPNERVYKQIAGVEDTDNIQMILLSTAYYGFSQNYKGLKYIIFQKDFLKAEEFANKLGCHLFQTGGSVSTTALDVGIFFRCRRIIFLGLDLAFTNNFVHAEGTSRRELTDTNDLRKVEDINGNFIYTSRSFDMYRRWIENRIKDENHIEFIDATEGGAKIKGFKVMSIDEVLSI
jgi:hypothetical protein